MTEQLCRAVTSVSRQQVNQMTQKPPKRTLPTWGEANHKRGRGQNKTHTTTPATQKERGEEPGGSRGQRERDTTAPEGVQTCLSGVQKRGQGSYYDEYLSEGAHSTPTTQETWCRGNEPHTGPKAFSAMSHNGEGKSMHNNHSKHRGKATRPSPEATIPRGRDQ